MEKIQLVVRLGRLKRWRSKKLPTNCMSFFRLAKFLMQWKYAWKFHQTSFRKGKAIDWGFVLKMFYQKCWRKIFFVIEKRHCQLHFWAPPDFKECTTWSSNDLCFHFFWHGERPRRELWEVSKNRFSGKKIKFLKSNSILLRSFIFSTKLKFSSELFLKKLKRPFQFT